MAAKRKRPYYRRLPLVEWWAWVEAELAWEKAWKRSAWAKWILDKFSISSNNV